MGGFRNDDTWWQGGGGVKNCQNGGDVICGCPQIDINNRWVMKIKRSWLDEQT